MEQWKQVNKKHTAWKGMVLALLLSGLWIYFVTDYARVSGMWENRSAVSLIEFIGLLGSFFAPIVLFFLIGGYIDRVVQAQRNHIQLQGYLNELIYPSPDTPDYTRQLTDELRNQIVDFKDVFKAMSQETKSVRHDLKQWSTDLSEIISQIDAQTITSIKIIAEHTRNLAEVTRHANEQAQQTSELFSEQAVILQRVTKKTADTVTSLFQEMTQQTENIQQMLALTEKTRESTKSTADQLTQISNVLNEQGVQVSDTINRFEETAKLQNAHLFGNLEKVLAVFKAHGQILDEEVEKSLARLEEMQGNLMQKTSDVFQVTNDGINRLMTAETNFVEKTKQLKEHIDQTREILNDISKNKEVIALTIPQTSPSVANEDYLKDASVVLQELQKISVDMAEMFTPKIQESLWEKYYAGDKAVFMRYVTNELSDKKKKKISSLYRSDSAFQKAAHNYMNAFEKMTKTLDRDDTGGLLMASIIGSDTGRLYMLLADILKKDKKDAH